MAVITVRPVVAAFLLSPVYSIMRSLFGGRQMLVQLHANDVSTRKPLPLRVSIHASKERIPHAKRNHVQLLFVFFFIHNGTLRRLRGDVNIILETGHTRHKQAAVHSPACDNACTVDASLNTPGSAVGGTAGSIQAV